jgi:CheY-like chemotaxis protein
MEKATVLVVDDDVISLNLLSKLIAKLDYNVVQATDGTKALEILRSEAVDLVVADYDMPPPDGLALL